MSKPLIAITMGDPAGVGPEVCLQLLANAEVREFATPVIYGDLAILRCCADKTGLPAPQPSSVRDLPLFDDTGFEPGVVSAKTGAAGYG
jgi:4-hydroxythreonine-4-phosphate dehydrogenase